MNKRINQTMLVKNISEETGLPQVTVRKVINEMREEIIENARNPWVSRYFKFKAV